MTTPVVNKAGPTTVDVAGVLGPTSLTWDMPLFFSGAKIHFGNITGLTGTLSASWDNGTTFTSILSMLQDGTLVTAGGTITAADDAELFFQAIGANKVKFTTAAGSGPLTLITTFAADAHVVAILRKLLLSGLSATITDGGGSITVDNAGTFAVQSTPPAIQCYSFIPDGTDELLIDATARKFWGWDGVSIDDVPDFIKFYDKATAPSEADTPFKRNLIPANSTPANGSGSNNGPWPAYIPLTNGLGVRVVEGIADNNDVGITASKAAINIYWST